MCVEKEAVIYLKVMTNWRSAFDFVNPNYLFEMRVSPGLHASHARQHIGRRVLYALFDL